MGVDARVCLTMNNIDRMGFDCGIMTIAHEVSDTRHIRAGLVGVDVKNR
jgi:hypothetical protein